MLDYPKTKYHVRGGGSVIVASPEQEKILGADWTDRPPTIPDWTPTPAPAVTDTTVKRPARPKARSIE